MTCSYFDDTESFHPQAPSQDFSLLFPLLKSSSKVGFTCVLRHPEYQPGCCTWLEEARNVSADEKHAIKCAIREAHCDP